MRKSGKLASIVILVGILIPASVRPQELAEKAALTLEEAVALASSAINKYSLLAPSPTS